jgi:diguanylate cyclase (GGDEF)-like protein/PAS domain S-box-containing protein
MTQPHLPHLPDADNLTTDQPGSADRADVRGPLSVLALLQGVLRKSLAAGAPRATSFLPVSGLLSAVERALQYEFASRCAVWIIAADGARMRTPSGAPDPWTAGSPAPEQAGAWQPVTGPVADALSVGRPIELGLASTAMDRTEVRSFARVVPIVHRGRIAVVVAVVRDAPMPMFGPEDRLVLDTICERIESALANQDLRDALISAQTTPVRSDFAGSSISDSLFNQLSTVGGDIVFRHRFGAGTEYVSAGVRSVLGYDPAEFLADPGLARRVVHPEDRHQLANFVDDLSAYDQQHLLRTVTRDGTVVWQLVRVRPVTDGQRIIGIEGLATDVSMMKRTEAELSHQARSDPLTNLANRLTLREYVGRSLARLVRHPGTIGLLYLDLTGFKAVNDTLGHPTGDQAIVTVAERLTKVTRREDVVARVGGDEFAILMPDLTSITDATATAQRIITSIENPIEIDGQSVRISTGVGIAIATNADADVDELLANADSALLAAKRSGRGRWQLFQGPSGNSLGPDRGERIIASPNQITAGNVRAAFAAGMFSVNYSPIVDVKTGRCERVEALLRWDHPELGLLDADDFLTACEEAELMHSLDDWVLAQACRQVAKWNETMRSPLGLAVNATPSNLARAGFGEAVISTLAATGLSVSLLTVEVPEPAVTELSPTEISQLESLRRSGVRIAIDRFGLGSTSIRALRRLPIDEIKLDRTLVAVLDPARSATEVDVEITKLAMQVSQSFGAQTVAVGVERPEQARALAQLGCSFMQGHLFEKPLTAQALTQRITNGLLQYPITS